MSHPKASFPDAVWDGLSDNPFRKSRYQEGPPDGRDWDRIVSEVIAIETNASSGGGTVTSVAGRTGDVTLTAADFSGVVAIANGGTGAITAPLARTALGLGTAATAASTDFLSPTGSGAGLTALTAANISAGTANITVTNGVVTTGNYSNPSWITTLGGNKITGNISGNAASITGSVPVAQVTGAAALAGATFTGSIAVNGGTASKPTITGVRADGTALASLLTALVALGFIVDSSA